MQRRHIVIFVLGLALLVAGTAAAAVSGADRASGTLNLAAALTLNSRIGECAPPPGMDACAIRTFQGPFPGLGVSHRQRTSSTSTSAGQRARDQPGRPPATRSAFPSRARVSSSSPSPRGRASTATRSGHRRRRSRSIGGTGSYVGASGSGTLERTLGEPTDTGRHGRSVEGNAERSGPRVRYDGSHALRRHERETVKAKKGAKSARVVFTVTAQDDKDASVAVACFPRSGTSLPARQDPRHLQRESTRVRTPRLRRSRSPSRKAVARDPCQIPGTCSHHRQGGDP